MGIFSDIGNFLSTASGVGTNGLFNTYEQNGKKLDEKYNGTQKEIEELNSKITEANGKISDYKHDIGTQETIRSKYTGVKSMLDAAINDLKSVHSVYENSLTLSKESYRKVPSSYTKKKRISDYSYRYINDRKLFINNIKSSKSKLSYIYDDVMKDIQSIDKNISNYKTLISEQEIKISEYQAKIKTLS